MATSPYNDTEYVLDFLGKLIWHKPASILDVGSGFGRWGFLCRCHMGTGESLTIKPDQKLRIDAVEAFMDNISPLYESVYNSTFKGDARSIVPGLGEYDVIICSHMIEHLEKKEAQNLIDCMLKRARIALVLCLPFGVWPQDAVFGNEYETHRSTWDASDFKGRLTTIKTFGRRPLTSGVVIYPVSMEAKWIAQWTCSPSRRMIQAAIRLLRSSTQR
jgi:hypothetical protein